KLPGITIKSLLEILEISKQGSHATLQKLKEQGLIIEKVLETDRRVKKLYSTDKGDQLIAELNKAQDELLQNIYQQVGSDWYDVMEALAKGRPGFDFIKHLKDEKES
ncbi:winged helix-turn-helix transcriptional regulator, partial [Staphylococcus aureus]|nr:winged helix-turn-helix transcriptional regulator [Staphylococcus aureus]